MAKSPSKYDDDEDKPLVPEPGQKAGTATPQAGEDPPPIEYPPITPTYPDGTPKDPRDHTILEQEYVEVNPPAAADPASKRK